MSARRRLVASVALTLGLAWLAWALLRGAGSIEGERDPTRADATQGPASLERYEGLALRARAEADARARLPGMVTLRRGQGGLVGRVTRFVAGEGPSPIPGVVVDVAATIQGRELERREAFATADVGEDGAFVVAPVPAASGYVLRARHPGFRDLVVGGLTVDEGRLTDVGSLVFGAPTSLTGLVTNATGRPLSSALVTVERERVRDGRFDLVGLLRDLADGSGPLAETRTLADGSFSLAGLPPGRYAVRVALSGFAGAFVSGVVVTADGDASGLRIVLDPGAGFHGRVLDERGRPVSGAAVVAVPVRTERVEAWERHETRTDGDGRYRLDTLAEATIYFVEAVATGHAPFGRVLPTRGVAVLDFTLPASGRVEGVVTDARTGAPVAGAEVLLLTGLVGGGTAPASVLTDAGGRYAFAHALPGPLLLLDARAPGYARATLGYEAAQPRVVRANETLVIDLALPAGGSVRGTVRDEAGRVLAFASVAAWLPRSPGEGEVAALTDAAGGYRLAGLRPETWTLTVSAPGYASPTDEAEQQVAIPEHGVEVVRDLVLRAGARLDGRVKAPDGSGRAGVRVVVVAQDVRRHGGAVRDLVAVSDRTGGFSIAGVPPAVALLLEAVDPSGNRARSEVVTLRAAERRTVDLVLKPGGRLYGLVTDEGGRVVEGARVRFGHVEAEDAGRLSDSFRADHHLSPRTFLSAADGSFVCDDVPPGPTLLRVDADGYATWFRRDLVFPAEGDLRGVTARLLGSLAVSGRVLAADTGAPVPGAWVYARARAGESPDGGRVDPLVTLEVGADGTFHLTGLPPGPVEVGVSVCLGFRNRWEDPEHARKDVPAGSAGLVFRLRPTVDPAAPR